ncbi:hypothetical protein [Leptospira koniambonensis]|uniref:hypothetical protein n=1 Tax=Leptospira koniambonensis TaxID=2484950 RepID=UPI00142E7318|nr:hypothetical protein [Leptospira koniambonensis]
MEWVIETISNPDYKVIQIDKRFRYWKWIDGAQKYLRVITLEDRETIHNAFFDRGFKR